MSLRVARVELYGLFEFSDALLPLFYIFQNSSLARMHHRIIWAELNCFLILFVGAIVHSLGSIALSQNQVGNNEFAIKFNCRSAFIEGLPVLFFHAIAFSYISVSKSVVRIDS